FSLLGVIIASRQPENRIGWIYLAMGFLIPIQSLSTLYYVRSVTTGGLPGARWAAWTSDWITAPVWPARLALFAFLLFPSGRLPSPRWRLAAVLAVALSLLLAVETMVDPAKITVRNHLPEASNPTGITALGKGLSSGPLAIALFLAALGLITTAIVGLLLR